MSKRKFTTNKTRKRRYLFFFLLLYTLTLGIGYAFIETDLDIIGVLGLSKYYANYTVNHYMHDLDSNTYTLVSTDNKRGRKNSQLTLENLKKTIPGATYLEGFLTGDTTKPTTEKVTTTTVLEDGSRVINLYYRRNYLYIQYHVNGGILSSNNTNLTVSNDLVSSSFYDDVVNNTNWIRGVYGGKVGYVNQSTNSVDNTGLHSCNNVDLINIIKEGYSVKTNEDWNTKSDGTGISFDHKVSTYEANNFAGVDLSTGDKTVTLYVNWVPNSYTVSFDANGGNVSPSEKSIIYDSVYGNLPTPTRQGYSFVRWVGPNLVDYVTFEDNLGIKPTDGVILEGFNGFISEREYVPIEGGETLYSNFPICAIYSYDENKNFIRRESSYTDIHPISNNAKYIRIEINKNTIEQSSTSYYKNNLIIGKSVNSDSVLKTPNNHTLKAQWIETKDFTYTGNVQKYKVYATGKYLIEAWGAAGGSALCSGKSSENCGSGGLGGYTSGEIQLNANSQFYIYVGGKGADAVVSQNSNGGWNGGGLGTWDNHDDESSGGGGGSTDIRTVSGEWNNLASLSSRIMVAGGGGGAAWSFKGGNAGGLVAQPNKEGNNATQTSGYQFGIGENAHGSGASDGTGGGGGGYWGGFSGSEPCLDTSSGEYDYGSGGSSYISGHIGSVAITASENTNPRLGTNNGNCVNGTTDITCSYHYSNNKFTNTTIIDGEGYNWKSIKDVYVGQIQPNGTTASGHSGNGYARITYLGP